MIPTGEGGWPVTERRRGIGNGNGNGSNRLGLATTARERVLPSLQSIPRRGRSLAVAANRRLWWMDLDLRDDAWGALAIEICPARS